MKIGIIEVGTFRYGIEINDPRSLFNGTWEIGPFEVSLCDWFVFGYRVIAKKLHLGLVDISLKQTE